jgi:hypothetical protein
MPAAITSGYDLLLELDKGTFDAGLERFRGSFPQTIGGDITLPVRDPITNLQYGTATYRALIEVTLPKLPSIQPPPAGPGAHVTLRSSFGGSSGLTLKLGVGGVTLDTGLGLGLKGTIDMACDTAMEDVAPPRAPAAGRALVVRLGTATVTFSVTATLTIGRTLALQPITVDSTTLQNALAPLVTALKTALTNAGSLPLTWPIPLNVGPTPSTRLAGIDFSAFQGSPEGVALGLKSACPGLGAGTPTGLRSQPTPALTSPARLKASNNWLVCLVADMLSTSLALPGSFVVSGGGSIQTWTGSVVLPPAPTGETFTLTSLIVDVPPSGPGIRVRGAGATGGFCWSAAPDFTTTVTFGCSSAGVVTPSVSTTTNANVSIPWWCILGAIVFVLIATLILGFIGTIVSIIISALVLGATSSINPAVAGSAAMNTLMGLPLPAPVASIGIPCSLVVFDDMEVTGSPRYKDLVPARSSGRVVMPAGATFDLDAGALAGAPARDLSWTGSGIQVGGGTRLTLLQGGFNDVSLRRLQLLGYAGVSIPSGSIPATGSAPLVFGAHTGDGLYARCAVVRTGGALDLSWVTYDTASARLTIDLDATTTQSKTVGSGSQTCGWIEVEFGPSISQLEAAVSGILGKGGSPFPWNPYAAGGAQFAGGGMHGQAGGVPFGGEGLPGGFTPQPDGPDIGGGFNLPTIEDLLEDRKNRPTVEITPHHETVSYELVQRAQKVVCRATPQLVIQPATFAWTAFGQAVPAVSGKTTIAGLDVTFDSADPTAIVIESPLGVSITGKVTCVATDLDGREVTGTATLNFPGQSRSGGCPPGRGGGGFTSLYGLAMAGSELYATVANARTAAGTLRKAVAAAAPPPAPERPASFREALLAAPAPRQKGVRARGN